MTTIGQRLDAELRTQKSRGKSKSGLAKHCSVSPSSVTDWISGRSKGLKPDNLIAACDYLNLVPRWLATGKGPRYAGDENTEPGPPIRARVPLISYVQAGNWSEVIDLFEPGDAEEWVPTTKAVSAQAYALRVNGDSMVSDGDGPSFPPGAIVVVDPNIEALHGSFVIVRLENEQESTFKQLVVDGGRRFLKPLNRRYPMLEITGPATMCGVVRQMVMDFD